MRSLLKRGREWVASARRPRGVRMGELSGTAPLDPDFGYGRGTPIDRYYIESFLGRSSPDIRGRALEVGDATYCRRFGMGIARQDVLHVAAGNQDATIVGDLSQPGLLPTDAFDCMVLTQTLHLIYDMPGAVREIHNALRPGGVALVTVPGITRIDRGEWENIWYWSLTGRSARRLFADAFGEDSCTIEIHGNVYAATCFLQGIALEEADTAKLDVRDPSFPVIITVRAVKST